MRIYFCDIYVVTSMINICNDVYRVAMMLMSRLPTYNDADIFCDIYVVTYIGCQRNDNRVATISRLLKIVGLLCKRAL